MNLERIHDPSWYLAMSLMERSATSGCDAHCNGHAVGERARRRLERWKAQWPITDQALFKIRLERNGLTEAQLLTLLDESPEAVRNRVPEVPEWLVALDEILEAWTPETAPGVPPPEALRGQETVGFLVAFAPMMRRGFDRLRQGARSLAEGSPDLPFDPERAVQIFEPALMARLLPLVQRTMILELNVARVEERLAGETPGERFRSFLESLTCREVVEPLLREYNVLTRQVMRTIDQWEATSLELLRRLRDDWPAIREAFCPEEDPGRLAQIAAGAGDTHRGGRSVHVLRFESGFRLVYKPRPLSVERHFQELLEWLNARGATPPFRALAVLDRREYGWVEFVSRGPCETPAEAERFHERLGGYLALLYALEATDFHCENLIAAGEHPVLIDLESLFQPRTAGELPASAAAGDDLDYTVMRVGLLPQRIWQGAESEGLDVSGMASLAGQLAPHAEAVVEGAGTDEMRLVRRRIEMQARQNRPILNSEEVDALGYVEAVTEGFTRTYRLLLAHRDELLAPGGALAAFREDPVRAILRPTQTYYLLLRESSHPDLLRDALNRDRFFDRLWGDVVHRPALVSVIDAERRDLENGDIPLFESRPASRDLWTSAGERIPGFFEKPGMELVTTRLGLLGEKDLERQRWFIVASMATLPGSASGARGRDLPVAPSPNDPLVERSEESEATPERLIQTAGAIGDRLATLAQRDGRYLAWVGLTAQLDEQNWEVLPLGTDLYGGLSGLALFLAYLGAISGEERHTALAREALVSLRQQVEESRERVTAIGGYVGWGSVIYTLAHLGAIWNEPSLWTEAEAIAAGLSPLIEQDDYLDLILGSAGCIGGLISLYRCRPSRAVLATAIRCGEHLLARATETERGIGWLTPCSGPRPLAGFSHGAAGFAWALFELAALTGQERFREAACAAIEEERGLFVPEVGNWLDLRPGGAEGAQRGAFAWCHGAPGVGLGRLLCLPHLDDARVREEIAVALEATLAHSFGANHSLCHGDLGNLETLLQASLRLGEPRWSEEVRRVGARVLRAIERGGCVCGVPLGVEVPGLMVGIAGIGYQLLRLAAPSRVPSVLGLAPPAPPVEKQ